MCTNNVGVARRIDAERVSKELADLIETLHKEVKGEEVHLPVPKVKKVVEELTKIIK
jgi:hypothetical protein